MVNGRARRKRGRKDSFNRGDVASGWVEADRAAAEGGERCSALVGTGLLGWGCRDGKSRGLAHPSHCHTAVQAAPRRRWRGLPHQGSTFVFVWGRRSHEWVRRSRGSSERTQDRNVLKRI